MFEEKCNMAFCFVADETGGFSIMGPGRQLPINIRLKVVHVASAAGDDGLGNY
jgi:hypothetical protein